MAVQETTVSRADVDEALPPRLTRHGEELAAMLGIDRAEAEQAIIDAEADMAAEAGTELATVQDEDIIRVERYIRALKKREYELQILEEQFTANKKAIQSRIDGLEFLHKAYAAAVVKRLIEGGKKKSHNFKFGVAGFRAHPAKAVIEDAPAIIAWAKQQGQKGEPGDIYKLKEEVSQSGLSAFVVNTGEVPPGAKLIPAGENFYVK